MGFRLVLLAGGPLGKELALDSRRLTLGRSAEADLTIDDDAISRFHCTLQPDGSQWIVCDTGSENGVEVNGERIESHRIEPGDLIRVGHSVFKFLGPETQPGYCPGEPYSSATIDGLTKVASKRQFINWLDQLTRDDGTPLAVTLLDIVGFTGVNEKHGHLAGDEALKRLGQRLRDEAGAARVGRVGGQVFGFEGAALRIELFSFTSERLGDSSGEQHLAACLKRLREAKAACLQA